MTPDNNNQNAEISALKNQCFTLLMALIVVSGTLTVYMYRQASLAGTDLNQARQLNVLITQQETSIENFLNQLVAYEKTHPDFLPVLKKYGINPTGTAPVAPAPATAPKK